MIAEVLNRDFVLAWLDPIEDQLRTLADGGDTSGQFAAALAAIERAKAEGVHGQPDDGAAGGPSGRRGRAEDATLDDQSFFSRDPVISLLQSLIEERIEDSHADLIVREEPPTGRRSAGATAVPAITDARLNIDPGDLRFDSGRRAFGPFETTDVRWIAEVGMAKAVRLFRDRHPFNPRPAPPVELAQRARLVMVGDWGSGLPRAQQVAQHMREAIDAGRADGREVHAVHLGDVYYSGFGREYTNRFLRYWPVEMHESDTIYSWSLNGNHDMYSGGHGYFGTLLADPRFACQDKSSWFSIENEHWRIVGIDTAWDEKGIHDPRAERGLQAPQAATLQQWAAADDRPFMLLSHHQLFSSYERPGPYLRDELAPLLDGGRIRAWFWGHEHKCVIHEPYDGLPYGRCLGHGGVPVYAVDEAKHSEPAVKWVERRAIDGFIEQWAVFGFAVLDFDGAHVEVSYIDEFGDVAYTEAFDAR